MKAIFLLCFTTWAIATEYLALDYLKFNARVELLDQVTRGFRGQPLPSNQKLDL
jgi:hypothetical protein